MAFRKRRFFRRRINGKLSRKHYTWVTAINTKCAITVFNNCTPPEQSAFCCPSEAQLVLLDNATIQSSFQDAIRIVRIHGSLTFAWNVGGALSDIAILLQNEGCEAIQQASFAYLSAFAGVVRSGIGIREVHNGDLNTLPRMNPFEDFDFSEGRWKQMRFHQTATPSEWGMTQACNWQNSNSGVCSNVTGASPGATATVCSEFSLDSQVYSGQMSNFNARTPSPWTWNYNNRVNLRVRENQLPVMSIGWGNVDFFAGQTQAAGLAMIGGVKLLIEVG